MSDQKYPLCAALAKSSLDKLMVQAFFDEMAEKGYQFAERRGDELVPARENFDRLWLKYLEIEPDELEKERRSMLDQLSQQGRK